MRETEYNKINKFPSFNLFDNHFTTLFLNSLCYYVMYSIHCNSKSWLLTNAYCFIDELVNYRQVEDTDSVNEEQGN